MSAPNSAIAQAQGASPSASVTAPAQAEQEAFPAEPYVLQDSSTVVSMLADGTGTRTQSFSVRIQSESALRTFSILAIAYPKSSESAEFIYARVRHGDGSVQETPNSAAIEEPAPVTREAPFYSDLEIKQLPVRNLRVGDLLEWQARSTILHPEIPGQFWGQDYVSAGIVVLKQTFELRTPIATHTTVWTNPRSKAAFTQMNDGAVRIDRWTYSDLHPTVGPAAEAAKLAEEKRILTADEAVDLTEGKLPDFAWTTFPDWAAVGVWYRDLSAGRASPDAAIQAKVAELTAHKATDLEKAEALYAYVSSQIRYIGVAFGIGRFQPHAAAEVFANQYGDCKDKYTLLAAMLSAAGLHSDPALIGAGIRFNPAVPSPSAFNHLITHLTLDGHEVWLDATADVAPWRALVAVIRDRQALVIPSVGTPSLLRTPGDLPYPAYSTSTVVSTLDSSLNSESTIVFTFHDDTEIALRAVLRTVSPVDYGNFIQNLMANQGFGGTTSEASLDHLADPAQPLTIRFHYHRTRDPSWGENRITATFQPIGLPGFAPDKPPTSAIQLGTPRTETSTVEAALPAGWQAELPEAIHAHSSFASCDVTFRRENGKLLEERKLVVLKKEVPVSQAKEYQSWYETAGASGYPFVQLIPPINASAVSPHTAPEVPSTIPHDDGSDSHAAELVRAAGEKIRVMDPDAARKLLEEAKAINPQERGLWTGYAAIASQFGAAHEAVEELQRELSYHPDEVRLYGYIEQEQLRQNDHAGALATSRAWHSAAPDSPEATLALVQQLSADKQYVAASEVGQTAVARLSKDNTDLVDLRLATAAAQGRGGDKLRAAALLEPLLATVTDPVQINSIAYALAEANLDLAAAETAQRKALASLEDRSTGWTLNEAPLLVNRQQTMIAAAWDTLGWILYRQGKSTEALAYIEPAARVIDRAEVHSHLTAIATALHSPVIAERSADAKLRVLPLAPAKGRHGTAELRLLVVDGKVVATGPTSSDVDIANSSYKPGLTDGDQLVRAADLHKLLPPGSHAHLLRNSIVNCFGDVCQLVLIPLGPS